MYTFPEDLALDVTGAEQDVGVVSILQARNLQATGSVIDSFVATTEARSSMDRLPLFASVMLEGGATASESSFGTALTTASESSFGTALLQAQSDHSKNIATLTGGSTMEGNSGFIPSFSYDFYVKEMRKYVDALASLQRELEKQVEEEKALQLYIEQLRIEQVPARQHDSQIVPPFSTSNVNPAARRRS